MQQHILQACEKNYPEWEEEPEASHVQKWDTSEDLIGEFQ